MLQRLIKKLNRKSAQSLVEYTLVLALVIVVCIALLKALGGGVQNALNSVNSGLATSGS
ncbi:MAG: Flp family type IVb pilin [Verrucomicrobia bacterium]|nr:Flp family type IVb pilin [Verrucomicrobiota bacterium]